MYLVAFFISILFFTSVSSSSSKFSCISGDEVNHQTLLNNEHNLTSIPDEYDIEVFNFAREYRCIVQSIHNGSYPARYMIYRQKDGTGWGNQMRGLISAFNIAILTKRILLVDVPCFHDNFTPRQGLDFRLSPKLMERLKRMPAQYAWIKPTKQIQIHSPSLTAEYEYRFQELWTVPGWSELSLKSADLNDDIPSPYWVSSVGVSIDHGITSNTHYQNLIQFLYGTRSRYLKTMMLGKYLLGDIKKILSVQVQNFKQEIGLNLEKNIPYMTLQYRSFVDSKTKNNRESQFISCANRILEFIKNRYQSIYLATDDEPLRNVLTKRINYTNILTKQNMFVHSGRNKNCIHGGMIDWILLGEGEGIITTGTSFAVSAIARRGGLMAAYTTGSRFASQGCHEMREISNNPQHDLNF
eukprot:TRINITY_DN9048_c0_g1_i1.p1 TRINITY_DN9048_c0_g1~~TRINITY_DN9048_c0_g1_i1.p1  ORF type:complete len:412 (-),score=17.50 TRINITY_DN9048_c0_g1_i1:589-1824(-)